MKRRSAEGQQALKLLEYLLHKAWGVVDGETDCDSSDMRALYETTVSFLNGGSNKARVLFAHSVQEAWRRGDPLEMARELLKVNGYVLNEHESDISFSRRDGRREGARRSAEKRSRKPSPGALRLHDYEKKHKVTVTKANQKVADKVALSTSQLRRLLHNRKR